MDVQVFHAFQRFRQNACSEPETPSSAAATRLVWIESILSPAHRTSEDNAGSIQHSALAVRRRPCGIDAARTHRLDGERSEYHHLNAGGYGAGRPDFAGAA